MNVSFPPDLILFAISVAAFVVIGLPIITRTVSLPARVEFDEIGESELTPDQSSVFAKLDARLGDINYHPGGNWRPLNMQGQGLLRLYFSSVDPAIVTMNLLTSKAPVGEEQSANYLEIVTQYRDGSILSTRNAEVSDVFDRLPEHTMIERRGLRDPVKLKRIHDEAAAELLPRDPIHRRPDEFEQAFNDHHERWCASLLERGQLRRSPDDPDVLRPTVKSALRGVLNFVNPMADTFTPLRFIVAALFGLAAPAAAVVWLTGSGSTIVDAVAGSIGLERPIGLVIALVAVLAVSGAVVGFSFTAKSFIWSFLFTYLLLRLVAPTGFWTTLALCLWAGWVADRTARWRLARRKLA